MKNSKGSLNLFEEPEKEPNRNWESFYRNIPHDPETIERINTKIYFMLNPEKKDKYFEEQWKLFLERVEQKIKLQLFDSSIERKKEVSNDPPF